ncbi:hypothetical protein [Staphylococcus equorum]|uniref:Uncharacterized protein n=1 Tax=Staphylococcus equorum TaxID=246432 RepID=A0AAP7IFS3_9STAP|nr:hypothetical protein [Staphylococcus equorum]OEK58830.1 hypothetical protein ASS94_01365 [Staphylococcus equorum]
MKTGNVVELNKVDLSLEGYELIGVTASEFAQALEEKTLEELNTINERIHAVVDEYDTETIKEVKDIETERSNNVFFLEGLKKEFDNDKIKMNEGSEYFDASPKTVSLKSAIVRVGKTVGKDTDFVNHTNNGHYRLTSRIGNSYDVTLSDVHNPEEYEKMLRNNKISEITLKVVELAKAQHKYRDTHDDYYIKYRTIQEFQSIGSFVISNDILNNREVEPEALDRMYEAYKEVKEKYEEIRAIIKNSRKENDK